jgi:DUF2075 family protein
MNGIEGFILQIAGVILGGGITYGTMREQLRNARSEINELKNKNDKQDVTFTQHEEKQNECLTEIKVSIGKIQTKADDTNLRVVRIEGKMFKNLLPNNGEKL